MRTSILIAPVLALAACRGGGEQKPFPEKRFREIAKRCGFGAVTYTPRKTFWFGEEPLIDFSGEPNPKEAMECFSAADLEISKEHTDPADLGVVFVWETRS